VAESARRFVHEYVREWQPTDERSVERLAEALKRLQAGVNGYDVSVFVKPGGLCPFCNMTLALLRRELSAREFSLHEADLLHDEREALKVMVKDQLGERVLTYPVIYIRGARLAGGYEELKALNDSPDGLTRALAAGRTIFEPPSKAALLDALPSKSERPKLLYQAGNKPWLTFQTLLFGNVLRLVALFQVVLLILALALYDSSPKAGAVIMFFCWGRCPPLCAQRSLPNRAARCARHILRLATTGSSGVCDSLQGHVLPLRRRLHCESALRTLIG